MVMHDNGVYFPGTADCKHSFPGKCSPLSLISYGDLATEDLPVPRYATAHNVQIEVYLYDYSCSIILNIDRVYHVVHTCPYIFNIFNIQQYKVPILILNELKYRQTESIENRHCSGALPHTCRAWRIHKLLATVTTPMVH